MFKGYQKIEDSKVPFMNLPEFSGRKTQIVNKYLSDILFELGEEDMLYGDVTIIVPSYFHTEELINRLQNVRDKAFVPDNVYGIYELACKSNLLEKLKARAFLEPDYPIKLAGVKFEQPNCTIDVLLFPGICADNNMIMSVSKIYQELLEYKDTVIMLLEHTPVEFRRYVKANQRDAVPTASYIIMEVATGQ